MLLSDARSILPAIHVPTVVIHRTDYTFVPIEHARYLAENIEGARLVELPGTDAAPIWENPEGLLDAMREFIAEVTGRRAGSDASGLPRPTQSLGRVRAHAA